MAKLQLPDNIKEEAVQFVETVVKEIRKNGITTVDNYVLRLLASTYNTYLISEDLIAKYGLIQDVNGILKNQPFIEVNRKCKAQIIEILKELNLTPKARSKVKDNNKEVEEESPLMSFINGQ